MKIAAFNGSPRGPESSTRKLLLSACDGAADAGAETRVIDICELDIRYCNGCGTCYQAGSCILDDDFVPVYDLFLNADGIIFSSPVYINAPTAQLKTFIDRLADAIHCQRLTGTYGCSISTAGGSHAEEVAGYLNSVIRILGGTTTGLLGVNIMGDPMAVDNHRVHAYDLGFDLATAIMEKRHYPDQKEEHRQMRERMIELVWNNKDQWKAEYEYWQNLGVYSDR